jgi:hypothetical protein
MIFPSDASPDPKRCTLIQASSEHRTWTAADHRRACREICCLACGVAMANRWWELHDEKVRCVIGATRTFLLTWKRLPNHSDAVDDMAAFVRATDRLMDGVQGAKGPFRGVRGAVAGVEYTFLPHSKGNRLRPHLHLGLISDPGLSLKVLRRRLHRIWVLELGGHLHSVVSLCI